CTRDILNIASLKDATVEAGARGLDRTLRWVHVSELLDVHRLLNGGEFLLTTGMKLGDASPDEQAAYVRALAKAGAAGIGLELVQWLHEVPEPVRAACDEIGLPLLVCRQEVRFSTVTEEVVRLVYDRTQAARPGHDALAEELLSQSAHEPLVMEHLRQRGLSLEKAIVVVALELRTAAPQEGQDGADPTDLNAHLSVSLRRLGRGPAARTLAVAVHDPIIKAVVTGANAARLRDACCQWVRQFETETRARFVRLRVVGGVGRVCGGLRELPQSLADALAVIRFRTDARQAELSPAYDQLNLHRLLLAVPPRELQHVIQDELGPLMRQPAAERAVLLQTLVILLEENLNVTSAAKRLHLRRQSLYKRLEKLETMVGSALQTPDGRAVLFVALRALALQRDASGEAVFGDTL
ncbi:MAG TPA: PucR family transcriptional regulator, partial [Limnochordia bacterium]|nr:PucR family transcriptional regulator [Limnochordia bacterium]